MTPALPILLCAGLAFGQPAARAKEAYERAVKLEAEGNHAAALSLLWEAAGEAPGDADIQHRLGEALERIGALDAAIDAYRQARAVRPDMRKATNSLILVLVKAGRGPEAVEQARALVRAAPQDPDTHFTLGLALAEQDLDEGIRALQRALDLAPRHTLARYNLALVLKRADRIAEAIDQLNRAQDIEPRSEAHYTLGVIHWQQGKLDKAADELRAAAAAEPGYVDAHYTLGAVLRAAGDLAGAATALRRAIALKPDLWGAHYTLGQVRQQAGDRSGAQRHLADAERLRLRAQQIQEAGVWTAVGIRKLDEGAPSAAVESLRRAVATFEEYAPAHYQLGRALARLGDRQASRAAFLRAYELNPSLVPPRDLQ
jgi:tetratricopeptide (TPR) repeat protein